MKRWYYTHIIERFTGKIFSGCFDYKNKPLFSGDRFIQEIEYKGTWYQVGNFETVERICHPSSGVQETSLSVSKSIPFWWTCEVKSNFGRLVKIENTRRGRIKT